MNNSDIFLVNRNGISHKVRLDTIRNDVNAPVNQEIADLKQKDVDLDRKIDILQLDVNQNEADSDAADAALSARIDALEADPGVDLSGYATKEQLSNEEAARIAGDNALDTKITDETNARIAGDNSLGNEIDGVEQRVDTLEVKVDALEQGGGVDLTSYATKAYSDAGDDAVRSEFAAVDAELQNNINAEKAARIAGDNLLDTRITTLILSPMDYGANGDGTGDDSAAIQQCIEIAGADDKDFDATPIEGTKQVIDLGGRFYSVKETIYINKNFITIQNGTLIWNGSEFNNEPEAPIVIDVGRDPSDLTKKTGGNDCYLKSLIIQCQHKSNAIRWESRSNGVMDSVRMDLYVDYGLRSYNQGQKCYNCRATGTRKPLEQRTGVGFDIYEGDMKFYECVSRWNRINFRINKGFCIQFHSCHMFNGSAKVGGPEQKNSINMLIQGGGSMQVNDCYIDKGIIWIRYNKDNADNAFNIDIDTKMQFVGNHYLFTNGDPADTDNDNREDHECIFMLENDTGEVGHFPPNIVWGKGTYSGFFNNSDVQTNHQFVKLKGSWDADARDLESKLFNSKKALERPQSVVWNASKDTLTYTDDQDRYVIEGLDFQYNLASGGLKPGTEYTGLMNLGDSDQMWKKVFATQGTIDTSDERYKNSIVDLDQAEINVAKAVRKLVKRFKFNGEDKYSVGIIAQQVIGAFETEGLDPFEYSIIDNEGEYYGVNYSQLLCFIIGGLD